jgi:hypothetical protein
VNASKPQRHAVTLGGEGSDGWPLYGWTLYLAPARPTGDRLADQAALHAETLRRYDRSTHMWDSAHNRLHAGGSVPGEEWWP